MNKYLFFLGHQPKISIAEIKAVFSCLQINAKTEQQNNTFFIAETKNELDYKNLINTLGGTIKIAEKISENNITDFLAKTPEEFKIQFSLSGPNSKKIAMAVKKQLKAMGRSVRYIEPKNTATILHNKLVKKQGDLTIFENEIFVTRAIQPFEEFGERDYKRPSADSFSGMLPPKLARIMINLGMAGVETRHGASPITHPDDIVLLDPFCGSGTVLTEAIDLGFKNLIGSDISEKAINDTKQNIEWLQNSHKLSAISYKLYKTNATKLSNELDKNSVDLIISEPYMGNPLRGNEKRDTLKHHANDLAELYTLAFEQFKKVLKKNGTIIFIIPKFKCLPAGLEGENNWVEIDCINKIKKIGFEIIPLGSGSPPSKGESEGVLAKGWSEGMSLTYHRPKQHVARMIWGFKRI